MFKVKIHDFITFVVLTTMHVCAVLQPVVQAQANIKTIYPTVDRSLLLQIGYNYNHWMLVKSLMYSLLAMIGLWYSRHMHQLAQQDIVISRGILRDDNSVTAEEVKKEWLARNQKARDAVPFPMRQCLIFAAPWLLTFVGSGLINYIRLYLVIQHFCVSSFEAMLLHLELQELFVRRMLAVALLPYWSQIVGGYGPEELEASLPASIISYETHLLE
ncbi:hypothetical protein KR018_008028 [Drosophila ironensis]|nr:hypothetical protein KR018_008028 [Drosophila ironensis]